MFKKLFTVISLYVLSFLCFFIPVIFIAIPQLTLASSEDSCGLYSSHEEVQACIRLKEGNTRSFPLCKLEKSIEGMAAIPSILLIMLFVVSGLLVFGEDLPAIFRYVAWGVLIFCVIMLAGIHLLGGLKSVLRGAFNPAITLIGLFVSGGMLALVGELPDFVYRITWGVLILSAALTGTGLMIELSRMSVTIC
jgi:hypothetical protein